MIPLHTSISSIHRYALSPSSFRPCKHSTKDKSAENDVNWIGGRSEGVSLQKSHYHYHRSRHSGIINNK